MTGPARTSAVHRHEDAELVSRIAARDVVAFERLMREHNTRLFRTARAILRDDADAEDAVQDAYLDAYRHIGDFRADAQIGTWLLRIVINQSLMRLRRQKRERVVVPFTATSGGERGRHMPEDAADTASESPSSSTFRAEVRRILERRVDELPVAFRTVFMLRDVEEMSGEETAAALGISPATVRTRLFRARSLLREALARDLDLAAGDMFRFAGRRCDRIVAAVLARVEREHPAPSDHRM